jgi:hypothetical protein
MLYTIISLALIFTGMYFSRMGSYDADYSPREYDYR